MVPLEVDFCVFKDKYVSVENILFSISAFFGWSYNLIQRFFLEFDF